MVHEEIKKSGYDGLLPAGIVITGGTAELPGILKPPVRFSISLLVSVHRWAYMAWLFHSRPAYSTAVGLLLWGLSNTSLLMEEEEELIEGEDDANLVSRFRRWLQAFIP